MQEGIARAAAADMRECPACKTETLHTYLFSVNRCTIWRCGSCGLGRADAARFDPSSYYTADYFSGKHSDGYADYCGAEPVLRRGFCPDRQFLPPLRPGGRPLHGGRASRAFLLCDPTYFCVSL